MTPWVLYARVIIFHSTSDDKPQEEQKEEQGVKEQTISLWYFVE